MSSVRFFTLLPVIGFIFWSLPRLSYGQNTAPSPAPSNEGTYAVHHHRLSNFQRLFLPNLSVRFQQPMVLTSISVDCWLQVPQLTRGSRTCYWWSR
ncbi:hypothetical protein SAY86_030032 [Trapa natans]|uniref:Secreted protein n=1 Tax=Trapa natans TaxID=22666 RepID=A0AAN7MMF9_TRANT|nr:hypothetical protein SAY86_030032 [Trapa natans]